MDLTDRRVRGVVMIVSGLVLLTASLVLVQNRVPFCEPTVPTGELATGDQAARLQQRFGAMERSVLRENAYESSADIGPVYAFYNASLGRYWVVHTATISGDQVYGPFDGRPQDCSIY